MIEKTIYLDNAATTKMSKIAIEAIAIGRVHDIAHGSLRLSLSDENTEEEIDYTIKAVKEVVEYLRSISPVWRDLVSGKKEFVIK